MRTEAMKHLLVAAVAEVLTGARLGIGAEGEDELDALLREVKPPARFQDYRPRFSVRKVLFKWTAFMSSGADRDNRTWDVLPFSAEAGNLPDRHVFRHTRVTS